MNNQTQPYKGYVGSIEFSEESGVFYGKVLKIRDLVSYEADTHEEMQKSFEEAVDDYIELFTAG